MHDTPDKPPEDVNPYASPSSDDAPPLNIAAAGTISLRRNRELLKAFRLHMNIAGGFWIFFGSIAALAIFALVAYQLDLFVISIILVICGLWIGLGIATCLKQLWAVYVGLVLSYLTVISNLWQGNVCGLTFVVPVIIFAHLAISKASQLRRAGIPLNTKPGALFATNDNPFSGPNFEGIKFDE